MFNLIISDAEKYLKTFNCVQPNNLYIIELFVWKRNKWNHLTVRKTSSDLFKNVIYTMWSEIMFNT